ncbi:MAG TPA: lamin tail domain-containing protein [Longimicrobiaceae bacterium]|nr:lamin tail domain-containing protein [Longimicrobiaceae bacterium]
MRHLYGACALAALAFASACADRAPLEPAGPAAPALAAAGPRLVINEVMADPAAVADDAGEWFEVHNWGTAAMDLQGWTVVSNNDAAHVVATSVSVPAGGYVVLGRNGNSKQNGGVTVGYVYGTGLTLANSSDWLVLRDPSGATVDSVAWSSVPAGASRGVRDPSVDNTAMGGTNWTTQTTAYGKGDKGTPRARNDGQVAPVAAVTVSPSSATVGAGATQQFTATATDDAGSTVATTFTWTSADPAVATVDGSGLATGVAAGTATIRATAPNGVYGEATLTVGAGTGGGGGGAIVVNEVMPNPNAVADDAGEWVEVYNWGSASVDLRGWILASNNDAAHTIATSVVVPAGGYAVLARNGNGGVNGGVSAAYVYGTGLTLANSADWVALRDASGATVDSVAWSSVPTGASRGVADASQDNTAMGGSNWTTQTSVYGSGDKGTPGARNDGYVSPLPAGPPATVTVSPSSVTVEVGSAQQLSATAVDANGKTTSTTYAWSSSSPAVATVDAAGLVTALAAGSATIRATAENGVYGEAAVTVVTPPPPGSASELVVRVLDIGQGDANLITNGTSRVLIDGGPDSLRMGRLLDSLSLNNSTIDVVILSHQHYDHHAGLRELFNSARGITVRYFFENRDAYNNAALQQLRDSVDARASRGQLTVRDTDDPCGNGSAVCTVTLNGGAKLHVMRPNPAGSTPNNRSTPVKLVGPDSASFSMWFAGDAEHEAQEWFVGGAGYAVFPGMKVNVVKGNHHGSCNGVRSSFVRATDPDWVTFSLAVDNSYGHVHDQTKEMYSSYGKPWYRTDQNGTVTIRSPGTEGGGYTVSVTRGGVSSSGPVDRASSQAGCNPLP